MQQPPTSAQCLAALGVPCYDPQQIRAAYGVDSLINTGYSGAGETIVLIESYGSPTLAADLEQFDTDFGLPDPPSLTVLAPIGPIPPFDSTQPDQVGWAIETSLDVQWAHAMAPGASIVVLASPVDETEGGQGLRSFWQWSSMRSITTWERSSLRAGLRRKTPGSPAPPGRRGLPVRDGLERFGDSLWAGGRRRWRHQPEQADYNLKYLVAVALLDGRVGPAQLDEQRVNAPDVQALLRSVEIKPNLHVQ